MAKIAHRLGWLGRIKATWYVLRDPRTPMWSKMLFLTLALLYGLSPIDLVPEAFVPFAGLLDDAIMIPFLIWLSTRFAPRIVRQQSRERVEEEARTRA